MPQKGGLAHINWSDINLDSESYVLQCNPVSSLPKTIPGLLQKVSDLQAMGVLSSFQVPRLLNNPDLASVIDPMMAVTDLIYKKIDDILDQGVKGYKAPDSLGDLNQELTLFTQAYAKAQLDGRTRRSNKTFAPVYHAA